MQNTGDRHCQPLWQGDELVAAVKPQVYGAIPASIEGISIDSRSLKPGEAFFAINGNNFDGHDFIVQALEAGASCVIAKREYRHRFTGGLPQGVAIFLVDEPLEALRNLATAARKNTRARVIAITGSAGKTTTKEALSLALGANGDVHCSPSSFNNHWGVPLSLARMPRKCDYAIFEVGMNNPGEIADLARLIIPEIVIITNVANAHLANFADEQAIAAAKAEIFLGMAAGGKAILNYDNQHFNYLASQASARKIEIATFGLGHNLVKNRTTADVPDAYPIKMAFNGSTSSVIAKIDGQEIMFKFSGRGDHLVSNMLAVLLTIRHVNADLLKGCMAISGFSPVAGRGKSYSFSLPQGILTLIDESYNANPASMVAALNSLSTHRTTAKGRLIAVLGDMHELGERAVELHRQLSMAAGFEHIDKFYLCGRLMENLWHTLPPRQKGGYAISSKHLQVKLLADLAANDTLMVKGSLASKMSLIVEKILKAFASNAIKTK